MFVIIFGSVISEVIRIALAFIVTFLVIKWVIMKLTTKRKKYAYDKDKLKNNNRK